jgi:hypothetical protein
MDCQLHTVRFTFRDKCRDCGKRRAMVAHFDSMSGNGGFTCQDCHDARHEWRDRMNKMVEKRAALA